MQEIKSLLTFATLLECGTMSSAAEKRDMTPSAGSEHISRLESTYGLKPLNRSTRSLTPTDAGRALADSCRRLLRCTEEAFATLGQVNTDVGGSIKITLPSAMAAHPALHRSLRRLLRDHPAVRPQLLFGDGLIDLQRGDADIALRGGEHALDDENLVARLLTRQRWLICASPDYLAEHPVAAPQDLASCRWLRYLPARLTMRRGTDFFELDTSQGIYCGQLNALAELAKAGLGLALFLDGDIAADLAEGRLKTVLPDWTLPSVDVYAVTPYRIQSARTQAVLDILLQEFDKEGEKAV